MEKFRRRKVRARVSPPAKVTSIVARSSHDSLITAPCEDNRRIGRQNSSPWPGSDSGSCSHGASAEIELFDQGKISSSLPPGTPMKKLLADEMSKETESKRRSPSVIARLMGLDGLPSHHNCNKQRKKNAEDRQPDEGSIRFRQRSKHYDGQLHGKSLKGQQQFKDVYEVVECSNMATRNCSSQAATSWNSCEDEIAFIRQKFMEVKRCSTDEKLRNSKEFHDALEVLDSNKDILLKFLHEPDSLFLKHLYEVCGAPESYWEHFWKMKSTNSSKCSVDALGKQSGREASLNTDINHSHKRSNSSNGHLYHRRNLDFQKPFLLEEGQEVASSVPTRIVVLKPNLGKVQSTSRCVFSPSSSHVHVSDADMYSGYSSIMHAGSKMERNCNVHCEFDINDCMSQESRELAREITRRLRHNLGVDSTNISSFGYYGYSADESGRDMSENDSSYDSEVTTIGSQSSSSSIIHKKASTSRHAESSVNREAKRRLSERWNMTQRSHLVCLSSNGSTLGEMLAIPDVDIRPRNSNAVATQDECFQRVGSHAITAQSRGPLGISSRDGWKDGCVQNLSRSRSLPASPNHLGSPKSSRSHEVLAAERFLARKESVGHLINLSIKKGSERKEAPFMGSAKSSYRKSKPFYPASAGMISGVQEIQSSRGMMTKSLDENDSIELKGVLVDVSFCRQDTTSALHTVTDEENINVFDSASCPDQQVPAPGTPAGIISQENFSTCDLPRIEQEPTNSYASRSSCLLYAATQPESPVSSKESEQPSPISVLETPFVEELSSGSECFERVSADLHGLRMQLQLLKLESEAYDGGLALISSDEDVDLFSKLPDCKGLLGVGKSWESSYLVDVLTESKLDKTGPVFFLATWHFSDCPIAFEVFGNLEKKYSVWETCLRSDRRLLFDRINSRIIEISQQRSNLYPWVKQQRNVGTEWWKDEWFETELHKLLENHEKQMSNNATNAMILDSMPWLELDVHVDAIGRDIEGLLMDELVGELLPALK